MSNKKEEAKDKRIGWQLKHPWLGILGFLALALLTAVAACPLAFYYRGNGTALGWTLVPLHGFEIIGFIGTYSLWLVAKKTKPQGWVWMGVGFWTEVILIVVMAVLEAILIVPKA